jgi:hypothetical protein
MIVSELIEYLNELPQDNLVLVNGYESGYNELERIAEEAVVKRIGNGYWDGDYEDSSWSRKYKTHEFEDVDIQAVILS